MPTLSDIVCREVIRLKAISRRLSEINYAPLHDETDMLEVIVSAILKRLERLPPNSAPTADRDLPKAA